METITRAYPTVVPQDLFPRAARYRALRPGQGRLKEPRLESPRFEESERHLQCVWFDPALRPDPLRTVDGERVLVEHPGIWNLEAGPDFLGAVVEVGPERRKLQGDVEIHIHPSGWKQHGHHGDPRYRNVRCHVTYFPGKAAEGLLPPGTVQVSLRDALQGRPEFSFETIDVTAYPFATRATIPPCSTVLTHWTADAKSALLDAAGEERLRRKTERLAMRISEAGPGQALYEELLAALGFKHNKLPFRRLASVLPLDVLRNESGGNVLEAYALLAGVAGLLPRQVRRSWDRETRRFVRTVWDHWWKRKHAWTERGMERAQWRLSGLRPANYPLRRMMAAAHLFASAPPLEDRWAQIAALPAVAAVQAVTQSLAGIEAPYWGRRLGLGGSRQPRQIALVGGARIHAVLVNVFVPFAGARTGVLPSGLLNVIPRDEDNEIVRRTAHFLFGPNHPPTLYHSSLRRQGLIQVFHDYCLIDRSRCATCSLPAALRNYGESHPEVQK
jgi:hypothetical protein